MAAVRTLKTVVFMGSSRNCVPPCEAARLDPLQAAHARG